MGNTIASRYECFNAETGKFDLLKYAVYRRIQLKKRNKERDQLHKSIAKHHHEEDQESTGKKKCAIKKKRRRSYGKISLEYLDSDGNWKVLEPKNTLWYAMYILDPRVEDNKFKAKFRRRFRMKHESFLKLLDL
eukprot:14027315-Ditylum_brightwellii.AAC.1